MGAFIVCSLLLLAFVILTAAVERWHKADDSERNRENLRRANIHRNAGNLSYPHEMRDGSVRWLRMDHDLADV